MTMHTSKQSVPPLFGEGRARDRVSNDCLDAASMGGMPLKTRLDNPEKGEKEGKKTHLPSK